DDDEDESDNAGSDDEAPPPPKQAEERDKWKKDAEPVAAPAKSKKTKKSAKPKKAEEDDEIAALLQSLDKAEDQPEKVEKGKKKTKKGKDAEEAEAAGSGKSKKDKKKKKKKGGVEADDVDALVADLEKNEPAEPAPAKEQAVTKESSPAVAAEGEEEDDDAQEGGTAKKDKKKKKKKKEKGGDEDEEKSKKKKPTNKIAELIKEQQRLIEEQKEAQKRAEEEARLEEERADREYEEKKRLEEEKKEEKKRRKAEEVAKAKREGTFLTKKQKEQQARAQRLFQNQGIVLPPAVVDGEAAAKPKKPFYGKKKPPPKKAALDTEEQSESPEASELAKPIKIPEKPAEEAEPTEEAAEGEDEIVDDWEQIAEVSPVKPAATSKIAKADDTRKRKAEEPAESDESSEEDEEEESDEEESEEESESSEEEEQTKETKEQTFARIRARIQKRREQAEAKRTTDNLRSPVICVLGHVDTGKTKMLDTIRRTNVQDGEAGGITQQIGATRVPDQAIKERCRMVTGFAPDQMTIPGFLIIDTPGHESFANLRSRGSSLCDFAILVVDIMHGLEPQTIESLKLLLKRETPFVVALNKIDRLYNYESNPRKDIWQHLKSQPQNTQMEFKERYENIITEFAEQGVNVVLANKNKDPDEYISIVPTSAMLGDGIGNLMAHIVDQAQTRFAKRLTFCEELDCTVMEVRSLQGLGTTIDVILINGTLRVNDILVLTGTEGPIVTPVRDLLMPQPLREIRVKNEYEHYKEIKGSQGVKVLAKNLERTVAGLPLYVVRHSDELEVLKEDAEEQLKKALMAIKKKAEGVYVQASTLGSLEALLEFLKTQKIPYSGVNIGPVHKKDVQKSAAMLEHNPEFACILAFDVPVDREVQIFADREGVRIFQADIIYHLEDAFLKY
ncbi:Elongation factor, partial [Aphelenchoides avenae]